MSSSTFLLLGVLYVARIVFHGRGTSGGYFFTHVTNTSSTANDRFLPLREQINCELHRTLAVWRERDPPWGKAQGLCRSVRQRHEQHLVNRVFQTLTLSVISLKTRIGCGPRCYVLEEDDTVATRTENVASHVVNHQKNKTPPVRRG